MVVDAGGGVGSGSDLVAESGRPCRRREDLSAFEGDDGCNVQDISVVEAKSLADYEILVGVLESDLGRG